MSTTPGPDTASRQHVAQPRTVRAPHGTKISCPGWQREAALWMLLNNLDPAERDEFRRLEGLGLTMYDQMTAGSWIYIGIQGTYETLAECARQHFGGSLAGCLTVTAGLAGMGNEQPLAVTMNEGVCLIAEVYRTRIDRRLATRYLASSRPTSPPPWRGRSSRASGGRRSRSAWWPTPSTSSHLLAHGIVPIALTDQTSAHYALEGYVPQGLSYAAALALRKADPEGYIERSMTSMAAHMRAMLELQRRGAVTFDYGNNLRGQALAAGVEDAFGFAGFVPLSAYPNETGPFRWASVCPEVAVA